MRDGWYVDTVRAAEATEASLIKLMVGRDIADIYGERESEIGEVYFCVEGASGEGFREVSLSLRRGEILGLAGLVGAGRTELARGLVGIEPMGKGTVRLDGETLRIHSPAEAIRHRVAYLTEDRKDQGLFLRMTVRDNCVAPSLRAFAGALGLMDEGRVDAQAEESRRKFNIITPGIRQQVRNLSGGNQQKVLLAMWMGIRPRVLVVDEPTRGVDVGARSEIYALLRALAATGVGILMISSDLLEVLGLTDRIVVMRGGRIAGEFSRAQATEEKIIACASGVGEECVPRVRALGGETNSRV
jgi:ABC-type sugar transport system ATPase subunit